MKKQKKLLLFLGLLVIIIVVVIVVFFKNQNIVTLNCYTMDIISDEVEEAVNAEFKKLGFNFKIHFEDGYAPEKLSQASQSIDLMQCYKGTESEFISLEPFLKTEAGKKLEDAYTENEWKLYYCDESNERKLVGSKLLYGMKMAYSVDQKMMDQLGWKKESFQLPLSSAIPFLKEAEKSGTKAPVYQNLPPYSIWEPYYEAVTGYYTVVIKKSEEPTKAVNFFEEPIVKDYVLSLYEIGQNNWGTYTLESGMDEPNHTLSLVQYTTDEWMQAANPKVTGKYYIPITAGYFKPTFHNIGLGILKRSNHPEEAFRAMVEIYTNPKISTLIQYGIEEMDYKMENGRVVWLTRSGNQISEYGSLMVLGNYSLTPPLEGEPIEKQDAIENYNAQLKVPATLGFAFNEAPVQKEIEAVTQVYLKNSSLVRSLICGTYREADPEGERQRIITELKKAGIDKVISECNRQLELFYNNKK